MNLASISSTSGPTAAQLHPLTSTSSATVTDPATDPSSGTVQQPSGPGRFASAISDAFASLGLSLDATASTGTDPSQTTTAPGADDTIDAFVQSLFAALHSQSTGATAPDDPRASSANGQEKPTASVDATARTHGGGRAHHGHGGKLEADLQSLIQELGASSTSDPSTTGTSSSTSTDSTLSNLEKSFDALVAKSGGSTTSDSDSLTAFLKALASGLHGAPATGNVVTTEA